MGAILISLVVLIIGSIIVWPRPRLWIWKKYYRNFHAFKFQMANSFQKQKMIRLPIGQSSFFLWASYYHDAELDGFTIRFVPTKKIIPSAPQIPASVISIKDAELEWDTTDVVIKEKVGHTFQQEMPIELNESSRWVCRFDESITSDMIPK